MPDDDIEIFWSEVVPYYGLDECFRYSDDLIAYYLSLYLEE